MRVDPNMYAERVNSTQSHRPFQQDYPTLWLAALFMFMMLISILLFSDLQWSRLYWPVSFSILFVVILGVAWRHFRHFEMHKWLAHEADLIIEICGDVGISELAKSDFLRTLLGYGNLNKRLKLLSRHAKSPDTFFRKAKPILELSKSDTVLFHYLGKLVHAFDESSRRQDGSFLKVLEQQLADGNISLVEVVAALQLLNEKVTFSGLNVESIVALNHRKNPYNLETDSGPATIPTDYGNEHERSPGSFRDDVSLAELAQSRKPLSHGHDARTA